MFDQMKLATSVHNCLTLPQSPIIQFCESSSQDATADRSSRLRVLLPMLLLQLRLCWSLTWLTPASLATAWPLWASSGPWLPQAAAAAPAAHTGAQLHCHLCYMSRNHFQ
jgi:hypothetical protein